MIARLNGRAQDEGLSNLEGRVMDGYALALDDDTFDISGSLNGVTVFPDLPRGLREMVRVTKPGGRVLLVAFGPPAKAEFLGFFIGAMRAAVPGFTGLPMNPPPLPFQVADSAVLRQKMAGAGLTDINLETVTWNMDIQSAMHLWNVVTNSNPIGAMLVANLTTAQKSEILQALDRMLHERSGGSGPAVLSTTVNVGRGTK
jgi:SAM-dependent methyltransferase